MHRRQGTNMKLGDLSGFAADQTVAAIANKTTVAGGSIAVLGGLTASEIAAYGGLVVAVLSVLIQWFYKARADRRAGELHHARLAQIREEDEEA